MKTISVQKHFFLHKRNDGGMQQVNNSFITGPIRTLLKLSLSIIFYYNIVLFFLQIQGKNYVNIRVEDIFVKHFLSAASHFGKLFHVVQIFPYQGLNIFHHRKKLKA